MKKSSLVFDSGCSRCTRIAANLEDVRRQYPRYHARPVPAFGDDRAGLVVVGLAPGMHGANASGRPFTGDHAGILLYRLLHEFGFSNQPQGSFTGDGLTLRNCRITNAVKCLPPANKPLGSEVKNCNDYLRNELGRAGDLRVILALGRVAHGAVISALGLRQGQFPFAHNVLHKVDDDRYLLDSYHCSRYNTQTGRLTENMFRQVFETAVGILNG